MYARKRLCLNGLGFRTARMGPDFLFVDSPCDHPTTHAIIELQVDDVQRSWEANPQGMKAGDVRVVIAAIA